MSSEAFNLQNIRSGGSSFANCEIEEEERQERKAEKMDFGSRLLEHDFIGPISFYLRKAERPRHFQLPINIRTLNCWSRKSNFKNLTKRFGPFL